MFSLSVIFFALNTVSTVSVVKKLAQLDRAKGTKESLYDLYDRATVHSLSDTNSSITLEMILANEKSLNLFINHLSKEYSLEILLSTIEFVQFQKYLQPHLNQDTLLDVKKENCDGIKILKFPSNVPRSEIIESNDMKEQSVLEISKHVARGLYNKYIAIASEFEVNISGIMRDELLDIVVLKIDDLTIKDFYTLFEECKNEMIALQISALQRMRYEKEFNDIAVLFELV